MSVWFLILAAFTCKNSGLESKMSSKSKMEYSLVVGVALLAFLLSGMYAAANIRGSDIQLGRLLLSTFALGVVVVVGYLYSSDQNLVEELMQEEGERVQGMAKDAAERIGVTSMLQDVAQSDWVRAMLVGGLNIIIPTYLVLAKARNLVRTCSHRQDTYFDELMSTLASWDWSSILYKFCLLGDVYFVMAIGFNKVTIVFLSWFNAYLTASGISFYVVLLCALIAAVLLFVLLPPLPGVAVYLFCGLLVMAQVNNLPNISFTVGALIAVALALVSKLMGSALQYLLGKQLGNNVTIQQQIGVDKVFIRAMEDVLRRPGLDPGKVAILVGGPDWPTSVLCGVLKLNLCQVMIGTIPVLLVLTPTVLAGAYQTVGGASAKAWVSVCMGITAVIQPLSSMAATMAIMRVIAEKGEELGQPRREHAAVEKLSRQQAEREKTYKEVTQWSELPLGLKVVIILAAILTFLSCSLFLFGSKLSLGKESLGSTPGCFRPFTVSGHIPDSYESDPPGLNGQPLSIVLPLGRVALLGYFASVVLQVFYSKRTKCLAQEDEEDDQPLE